MLSDAPLPNAPSNTKLAVLERTDRADGRFDIIYKAPIPAPAAAQNLPAATRVATPQAGTKLPPKGALGKAQAQEEEEDDDGRTEFVEAEADDEAPKPAAKAAPKMSAGIAAAAVKRRRAIPRRVKQLMPLLLHQFDDLEQYEEKEMLYGDERSTLLLPKIRLDRKKRAISHRGRGLAAHAELQRVLPRLVTYQTLYMDGIRRYEFEGARPESIHVLLRVLETDYRFRLEDLANYTTHGDLVLRALERLDVSTQAFDLDAIIYCPSIDAHYPFKFLVCGESQQDNFVTYMTGLKKIFDQVESVDSFRERVFSELKLGFEKFGPGCATPEFQEVELRLYKLLGDAGRMLGVSVGDIVFAPSVKGEAIRATLKRLHDVTKAIDDCLHLPGTLAAYYRVHFDLPFGQLFQHALAAIDEIAKSIGADLAGARPRDVETLTELVTTVRKLTPRSPLENLEMRDRMLEAAYAKKAAPAAAESPAWVRRYKETIFAGTEKFDARRFKKSIEQDDKLGRALSDSDVADLSADNPLADFPD